MKRTAISIGAALLIVGIGAGTSSASSAGPTNSHTTPAKTDRACTIAVPKGTAHTKGHRADPAKLTKTDRARTVAVPKGTPPTKGHKAGHAKPAETNRTCTTVAEPRGTSPAKGHKADLAGPTETDHAGTVAVPQGTAHTEGRVASTAKR
ncbi:hypothetical protein ACIP6P_08895 [Streptomyces sp. NPDC088729]|uniref:hypothetical protein n=1 Tax=Streptomyces sp. NPDC088729 TaxID=3365876 RepID=UPI00382B2076